MNTDVVIGQVAGIRGRAHKLILRELAKNGVYDLVPSHGKILVELYNRDRLPMSELAASTRRDKSTITTLVNKLERLGYVKRERSLDDGRSTYITLTEKGQQLRPIFDKVSQQVLDVVWRGFSEQEKQVLVNGLKKMSGNLKDLFASEHRGVRDQPNRPKKQERRTP